MYKDKRVQLLDIYCDRCGEYLGSYPSKTKAKCPDCLIYSENKKINDSNNRKKDTR